MISYCIATTAGTPSRMIFAAVLLKTPSAPLVADSQAFSTTSRSWGLSWIRRPRSVPETCIAVPSSADSSRYPDSVSGSKPPWPTKCRTCGARSRTASASSCQLSPRSQSTATSVLTRWSAWVISSRSRSLWSAGRSVGREITPRTRSGGVTHTGAGAPISCGERTTGTRRPR
ncbi:hypothetical protein ADL21_12570 [Streptomyces albus subsp. albus]|nr:hypothetical protein ADL21_12570 [Streptomyces albus subsp. albus]